MRHLLFALWLPLGMLGCSPGGEKLSLFAAISTKEVAEQIARDFQAETGIPVAVTCEASSTLARQIEQGADADLFLSADEPWADYLAERHLVEQRRDLLANRLVVVVPADSPLQLPDVQALAKVEGKIAVANAAVPAGRYARQALEKAGVWDRVKDRVQEGGNVRATLTYVVRDEVAAGFVYATDTATTTKVRAALTVPERLHTPIRYPLVLVRRRSARPAARRLYDYVGSARAEAVFRRAGFEVVPP